MKNREKAISQDSESWDAGYNAGRQGKSDYPVPKGLEPLSWYSGFIEGKADRIKKAE